jgi:dolichol-phosphate mannosyltransferase
LIQPKSSFRVLAIAPALNEDGKIEQVIARVPLHMVDEVLVVDDGSTDKTAAIAAAAGATVLSLSKTIGVGAALRVGFDYAVARGFDFVVVMAGNNKDCPEEIPWLLEPLLSGAADLAQGSRYLVPPTDLGDMPLYRRIATRVHPMLFNFVAGTRLTDTTNGFRAISTRVLASPALDLSQAWLDRYELEVYLLYKSVKLGFRVTEVPVTKIYPPRALGQTKMKPITGWWSILRPLVLLGLHIKR